MEEQNQTNQNLEQKPKIEQAYTPMPKEEIVESKNNVKLIIGNIVLLLVLVGGGVFWWSQNNKVVEVFVEEPNVNQEQGIVVDEKKNEEELKPEGGYTCDFRFLSVPRKDLIEKYGEEELIYKGCSENLCWNGERCVNFEGYQDRRIALESEDIKRVRQAVYTKSKTDCDILQSLYGEVCTIAFNESYELCENRFSEEKERSYLGYCVEKVLYLTDDLDGCKDIRRNDLCDIVYNNKHAVNALLKKDKLLCEKITHEPYIKECTDNVESLMGADDENLILSFDDGFRWIFRDLELRYNLFKQGKIDI